MAGTSSVSTWAGVYVSVFILAALGYVFANAWNNFAIAFMERYAKKDKDGNIIKPVDQTFYYAIGISVLCGMLLWIIYKFTNAEIASLKKDVK